MSAPTSSGSVILKLALLPLIVAAGWFRLVRALTRLSLQALVHASPPGSLPPSQAPPPSTAPSECQAPPQSPLPSRLSRPAPATTTSTFAPVPDAPKTPTLPPALTVVIPDMPYTPPARGSPVAGAVALSSAAGRMAHSRSQSDMSLSSLPARYKTHRRSQSALSDDSASPIDDPARPGSVRLIRNASGELVKPALRDSSRPRPVSMPGTPTSSKAVHFPENMEQVRQFFGEDRPMAVSAGSSPILAYESDSEFFFPEVQPKPGWDIRTTNWPTQVQQLNKMADPVRLERLFIAADGASLIGSVAVKNLSFHKIVVCRFSFDRWTTTSEVLAEYSDDSAAPSTSKDRMEPLPEGYDRFVFTIRLSDVARLESRTLFACVRYNVNEKEFWDNNESLNYQVDFVRSRATRKARPNGSTITATTTLSSVPRSRRSSRTRTEGKPGPESPPTFNLPVKKTRAVASGDSDSDCIPIKLKTKSKPRAAKEDAFATRYDFNFSANSSPTRPADGPQTSSVLLPKKVEVGSDEYQAMINKFCFFATPDRLRLSQSAGSTVTSPTLTAISRPPHVPAPTLGASGPLKSVASEAGPEKPVPELLSDSRGSESSEEHGSSSNPTSPESSGSSNPPSPDFLPQGASSLGLDFLGSASWPPSASTTPTPPVLDIGVGVSQMVPFRPRSASPTVFSRNHHRHPSHHTFSHSPQFTCIRG